MADTTAMQLSMIVTTAKRLPDLSIKNAQLVFVKDSNLIAFDWDGKRKFYSQVVVIATDGERKALEAPIVGVYYFVVDTAILWQYDESGWVQKTTPPTEYLFVGAEFPELGSANKLYVNKKEQYISIWDENTSSYVTVGNVAKEIDKEEIDLLFA